MERSLSRVKGSSTLSCMALGRSRRQACAKCAEGGLAEAEHAFVGAGDDDNAPLLAHHIPHEQHVEGDEELHIVDKLLMAGRWL
jgi:hypothetical protein